MRQRIRKGILTISSLLFPLLFVFLSPFVIVVAASHGIVNASAIIFGGLFLFSIVGSRLFCGWLCPAGSIQEQVSNTNMKAWNGRYKNASKYVIWTVWIAMVLYLWFRQKTLQVDFFYMYGIDIYTVIAYFIVVSLIFLFALLTGKRGMCHSLCWMAPFMIIGEKTADFLHIPRFRLKGNPQTCISCGQCNKRCPMSLEVAKMVKNEKMDSPECIYCLECVSGCPKKSIQCGIKKK